MRRLRWTFCAVALVAIGFPSLCNAQFNRVFVSARSGSDANSCNNINTPCQTFQGAVNQVAAGGAVLVLDTGGYGPITINKSVTIEAPPGVEAFIHPPSGDAITILAGGGDVVVLRGLTLNVGTGNGIDFISGRALHVEQCVIQGFQNGVVALRGSGTTTSDLFVEDTVIRHCEFDAIALFTFAGTVRASIDKCQLDGNSFGALLDAGARAAIRDSVTSGNSVGMAAHARDGRSSQLTVENCVAANNSVRGIQTDAITGGSAILRISNSTVTGNGTPGFPNRGGMGQFGNTQLLSRVNNTVAGNTIDTIGTIGTYSPR